MSSPRFMCRDSRDRQRVPDALEHVHRVVFRDDSDDDPAQPSRAFAVRCMSLTILLAVRAMLVTVVLDGRPCTPPTPCPGRRAGSGRRCEPATESSGRGSPASTSSSRSHVSFGDVPPASTSAIALASLRRSPDGPGIAARAARRRRRPRTPSRAPARPGAPPRHRARDADRGRMRCAPAWSPETPSIDDDLVGRDALVAGDHAAGGVLVAPDQLDGFVVVHPLRTVQARTRPLPRRRRAAWTTASAPRARSQRSSARELRRRRRRDESPRSACAVGGGSVAARSPRPTPREDSPSWPHAAIAHRQRRET